MGITYFPKAYIWAYAEHGSSVQIDVNPALPDINYIAMTKKDTNNFMYS